MSVAHRAWRSCRALAWALAWVAPLLACGGGSSQGSTSTLQTGADATHGAVTLGLSGGAQREVDRVWVTVGSVAMHASASQAWSSTDRSWVVLTLRTPVVVELTAVTQAGTQSDVTRVLDAVSVPAGSYGQMRLFPLAQEASLSDAASAAGLLYNAQVRYTDGSLGVVNVPLELSQPAQGWRVGLLDADIYGPSLPRMLGLNRKPEVRNEKMIPLQAWGLSAMSIGFLVDEETPMIWRGPMVMGALEQMMGQVSWGALDVLVVDMPPGTGDAQLTMAQRVALTGAASPDASTLAKRGAGRDPSSTLRAPSVSRGVMPMARGSTEPAGQARVQPYWAISHSLSGARIMRRVSAGSSST